LTIHLTRRIINKSNKIQEKLSTNFIFITNHSFQTRPGPRLGFRVLIGSLCRPGQFFFKNQNDVVLVKKNKSQRVATGYCRVTGSTEFFLTLFFLQPSPVPASGRPGHGSTRRAGPGFKTIPQIFQKIYKYNEETILLEFIILFLLIATILKASHRAIHR
jgi:hypothetical protein